MAIWAGVDEAGLGPRLGPLVVGLSVFRVPERGAEGAFRRLAPVVGEGIQAPVPLADSKRLFGPGRNLEPLERGVLAFARAARLVEPEDLQAWLRALALPGREILAAAADQPWYREPLSLPYSADPAAVARAARALAAACERARVRLLALRLVVLHPAEVNRALRRYRTKNLVNFFAAAPLLRYVFQRWGGEKVRLTVDRQGGRKDYAALLRILFYPARVEAGPQEADAYHYRVQAGERRCAITFRTRAEAVAPPVALASMAAKYTRELHMVLFNRFWQRLAPDLRPTAGYPGDAARFLAEIAPFRRHVPVPTDALVRVR